MKRYIAFLTIALALVACKKAQPTGEQYLPAPVLETSTGTVQFGSQGGQAVVSASTYEVLQAKTSQSWLTLSVDGSNVTFTAQPNTSIESRYATVELTSAGASRNVQVVQFGYNTKYIWEEGYSFSAAGGTLNLKYPETDETIRIKITGNWISAVSADGVLSITVEKNTEPEPREGLVEWKAGDDVRSIVIAQAKGSGSGGGQTGPVIFSEDFENEDVLDDWLFADMDDDGYNWEYSDELVSHSGIGMVFSQSFINGVGALEPDNWIVTPAINVGTDAYISFWVTAQDPDWCEEHFGVYITEDLDNMANLYEATLPVTDAYEEEVMVVEGAEGPINVLWQRISVKVPAAFASKSVYVAFRHFDCSDMYYLNLDDVMVTTGQPEKTASSYTCVPASKPSLRYDNPFAFYKKIVK